MIVTINRDNSVTINRSWCVGVDDRDNKDTVTLDSLDMLQFVMDNNICKSIQIMGGGYVGFNPTSNSWWGWYRESSSGEIRTNVSICKGESKYTLDMGRLLVKLKRDVEFEVFVADGVENLGTVNIEILSSGSINLNNIVSTEIKKWTLGGLTVSIINHVHNTQEVSGVNTTVTRVNEIPIIDSTTDKLVLIPDTVYLSFTDRPTVRRYVLDSKVKPMTLKECRYAVIDFLAENDIHYKL